jgi:hypothetical protein
MIRSFSRPFASTVSTQVSSAAFLVLSPPFLSRASPRGFVGERVRERGNAAGNRPLLAAFDVASGCPGLPPHPHPGLMKIRKAGRLRCSHRNPKLWLPSPPALRGRRAGDEGAQRAGHNAHCNASSLVQNPSPPAPLPEAGRGEPDQTGSSFARLYAFSSAHPNPLPQNIDSQLNFHASVFQVNVSGERGRENLASPRCVGPHSCAPKRAAFRILVALIVSCLAVCSAEAQVLKSPKSQNPKSAAEPEPKQLTLYAEQQPDPLLRYRLWPAPEHRRDENPAPLISRAVILSLQGPSDMRQEFEKSFNEWSNLPIDELPREQIRKVLGAYASTIKELRRTENLTRLEYNLQLDQLSAPEMIQTLLPELQEMRRLARLLSLHARLAVAEQRWDDAVDDCRLGFRLAEVAGHSTEFLIGRLVGFAISATMMAVIEEAIQQPECPNLYWALASLPENRLFETRDSIEFESVLLSRIFSTAGPLPDHPIGEVAAREGIRKLVHEVNQTLRSGGDSMASPEVSQLLAGIYVLTLAEPSRDLLASTEAWGERVDELSASEAVLRATNLKFARVRDRWVAWSMMPPELWDEYAAERNVAFGFGESRSDLLVSLVSSLTPAVNAARSAGRRTHQQRNWLLTIEAIRMHAADNGELPATIENMRPVPAWTDALANKSFGYHRLSDTKATLTRAPRWNRDEETTIQIELRDTK